MTGQRIGSLVAASFGLIYVLVNTAALPTAAAVALRLLAAAAFVAVLVPLVRAGRPAGSPGGPGGRVFGRGYWLVTAVEVVALLVGTRVLSGPLDAPEGGVAWVSVVVGVHFFALAVVFGQRFFHRLGGVITACGAAGLVLVAAGAGAAAIGVVAGVVPGAALLGWGWWGAHRPAGTAPRP